MERVLSSPSGHGAKPQKPTQSFVFDAKWRTFWTLVHLNVFKDNFEINAVFELPEGLGGLNPPTSPCRPPTSGCRSSTSGQNSTLGGRVSTPHLSFAEVGMLLDSHFLLMQLSKYLVLHHDDLNVMI